jgi:hypothetical protein
MGMFNKIKKLFGDSATVNPPPTQSRPEAPSPKKPKAKSLKELATEKGEPYVNILSMELDPANMDQGAFELDWNEKFVANLVRAGYQMSPKDDDADIVDRWFTAVCRNVVLETYEQYEAMNTQNRVVKSRDIGDGRSEVS